MQLGDLKVGKLIGSGGFAAVYSAACQPCGRDMDDPAKMRTAARLSRNWGRGPSKLLHSTTSSATSECEDHEDTASAMRQQRLALKVLDPSARNRTETGLLLFLQELRILSSLSHRYVGLCR